MAGPIAPPIAPVDLSGGGGSSDIQLIQGADGVWYSVSKSTGVAMPIQGLPGKQANPPTSTKELKQGSDGRWYLVDNQTGKATPVEGMPSGSTATPKDTVPGTGNPGTTDWDSPLPVTTGATPDVPVDVFSAQTARQNADTTSANDTAARAIGQQNANTSRDRLAFDQTQATLKAAQDAIQQQVDAGKLSNTQAIALFDAQVQMLTAGQNAGNDAVNYAKDANANRVGPQFGQHFADALSGRGVHFQGADFQYPTPDYSAIARQATAAAIAHLSPFAASIARTQAPPGGYGGAASGGGAYAGPVVTAAANQVAGQGQPPMNPQYTTPAPPQPGFGSYRPGG